MSHTTQKSFKDTKRDKPSHSVKEHSTAKKGGAGGKGTWGAAKDDVKFAGKDEHALDKNDPNFDPADQGEGGYTFEVFTPSDEKLKFFQNSITDLSAFKKEVRSACAEYLVSLETGEFITCIKDLKFALYHQDLPAILVRYSLDKSDKDRQRISGLLHSLFKADMITSQQMVAGFRKLFNSLDELLLDAPNARVILSEFVGHGIAQGYLDSIEAGRMEDDVAQQNDERTLQKVKERVKGIVEEYYSSNELEELSTLIAQGVPPGMHYEVVKRLVSVSLDRTNLERERCNRALAQLAGKVVKVDQVCKAMSILLQRVEDMFLDVPDILGLLSCIMARAVTDEALPPSFLLRLDLGEGDMGFQVAAQAQVLLKQHNAAAKLEKVWGVFDD